MESSDQSYRFTEVEPVKQTFDVEPVFIDSPSKSELAPSRVLLHIVLFLLTAATTTLTGAAWTVRVQDSPSIIGQLIAPVVAVINETAAGNFDPLLKGLIFTFTLLFILGAHVLGQ